MATFGIDTSHTDVQFSVKHMMVTTVRGKFSGVTGTLELDEANPAATTGTVTIPVATINTSFEQRDAHLRSGDFFDAEAYPEITFVATKAEPKGGSDWKLTGDLTIKGVTRQHTFDVEFLGFYTGLDGARRAGVSARTKIDREAWGLTWNVALESGGVLVGKEITIEVDIAAQAVVEAAAAVA